MKSPDHIKENLPLISTITLAFNVSSYIEECLDSIISQTYTNIEIIVVINGKSNDDTENIVKKIAATDHRIKLVYNHKNSYIGEGRLLGMKAVTGSYFTFVDGDDLLVPTGIADLVDVVVQTGGDIIVGTYQQISPEGNRLGISGMPDFGEQTPEEYLPPCFMYIDTLIHGKLYRSTLFHDHPIHMFEGNYLGEDKMLHLQFATYSHKIVRCNSIVHFYRDNPFSITKQLRYEDFRDEFRNLAWIYSTLFIERGFVSDPVFVTSFKSHHLHMLYFCLLIGGLKIFKDFPEEANELLSGPYIKQSSIRNYLNQWPLYVPVIELYRCNKYLGAVVCWVLNGSRKIRKKYQIRQIKKRIARSGKSG